MLPIGASAAAQEQAEPRLHTNQSFVEDATRNTNLRIDDALTVFAYVFDSLPDRVTVYPTENYYYFWFIDNGVPYAGDIRLDAMDRDRGQVHFGYFERLAAWNPGGQGVDVAVTLDAKQGVTVEKIGPLTYRISYRQKSVVFALNDLTNVKPPVSAVAPDESFLGPILDESGIRFYLLFDRRLKVFHYVLDESVKPADQFFRSKRRDRVLIGKRTGFAFYRDLNRDRKILIGVHAPNSHLNTYFDGPFDQLPENFVQGDALRDAMIASDPSVKGQIDRLGHFYDGMGRFLIQPFKLYERESDLYSVDRCAQRNRQSVSYGRCFVTATEPQGMPPVEAHPR